jgi:hypothetical protein
MSGFHDAAAVIVTLALCRALIEKGILAERMQCKCCSTKLQPRRFRRKHRHRN